MYANEAERRQWRHEKFAHRGPRWKSLSTTWVTWQSIIYINDYSIIIIINIIIIIIIITITIFITIIIIVVNVIISFTILLLILLLP